MVTDRYQHIDHHETVDDFAGWAAGAGLPLHRHRQPARRGAARGRAAARGVRAGLRPGGPRADRRDAGRVRPSRLSIAQFGSTRSINAGAAAAIAMHTWVRQHAFGSSYSRTNRWCSLGRGEAPASESAWPCGRSLTTAEYWAAYEPAHRRSTDMPIATPEVYRAMLDKAKAERFAYPAINVSSSLTLHAALRGLRRGGQRRHRPGLDRRRRVLLRHDRSRTWWRARWRSRRSRTRPPRRTRSTSPCTPTTARRTSSTASSDRCSTLSQGARRRGRAADLPVAHVGRLGRAARGEPRRSPRELLDEAAAAHVVLEIEVGVVGGEEDGVVGAHRRQALLDPRGRAAHGRGARRRRERPLHDRADVRQRARRLQAGQRQAPAGGAQGRAGGGRGEARPRRRAPSRSTWSSTAGRARCSRRSARRSTTAWSR